MKKISYEQALMMLVLGLTGCCIGFIMLFAAEHHKRVQYEQAACVLNDIRKSALDCDDLNIVAFEELQSDAIGTWIATDCALTNVSSMT